VWELKFVSSVRDCVDCVVPNSSIVDIISNSPNQSLTRCYIASLCDSRSLQGASWGGLPVPFGWEPAVLSGSLCWLNHVQQRVDEVLPQVSDTTAALTHPHTHARAPDHAPTRASQLASPPTRPHARTPERIVPSTSCIMRGCERCGAVNNYGQCLLRNTSRALIERTRARSSTGPFTGTTSRWTTSACCLDCAW